MFKRGFVVNIIIFSLVLAVSTDLYAQAVLEEVVVTAQAMQVLAANEVQAGEEGLVGNAQ